MSPARAAPSPQRFGNELTRCQFSNPEGTAALNLPALAEEGDSPFAGVRPQRRADEAAQQPGKGASRGGPLKLLLGVAVVAGLAYIGLQSVPANEPSPTTQPAQSVNEAPAEEPKEASPTAGDPGTAPRDASKDPSKSTKKAAAEARATVQKPAKEPETGPQGKSATKPNADKPAAPKAPVVRSVAPAQPKAKGQGLRIIRRVGKSDVTSNPTGVVMPGGSADRAEEIKRSMRVRRGIWDACIRRAQRDYPALVGKLVFTLSVSKAGTINGVTGPRGNAGAQYAAACLLGEFNTLKFPPGDAAQVQFPYVTR